jgi:hypothetical protein
MQHEGVRVGPVGVRVVETMHYKKIDDEFFPDE